MRRITEDARALLITAAAVARFRGAQECDISDLKVAGLLVDMHPGVALYPDAAASTSPEQIPFAPRLEEVMVASNDELGVDELRRLAEGS